jgi:hypothetical protein
MPDETVPTPCRIPRTEARIENLGQSYSTVSRDDGRDLGLSSLTAMSKKTAKRRAKARRKKANHRRKPNAR